jgi:hypothetical protein
MHTPVAVDPGTPGRRGNSPYISQYKVNDHQSKVHHSTEPPETDCCHDIDDASDSEIECMLLPTPLQSLHKRSASLPCEPSLISLLHDAIMGLHHPKPGDSRSRGCNVVGTSPVPDDTAELQVVENPDNRGNGDSPLHYGIERARKVYTSRFKVLELTRMDMSEDATACVNANLFQASTIWQVLGGPVTDIPRVAKGLDIMEDKTFALQEDFVREFGTCAEVIHPILKDEAIDFRPPTSDLIDHTHSHVKTHPPVSDIITTMNIEHPSSSVGNTSAPGKVYFLFTPLSQYRSHDNVRCSILGEAISIESAANIIRAP